MRVSFITWYPSCRRSDALAAALGGVSHLIHYLRFKQPFYAPLKYILQTIATWRHLWRDKPELVLVASPPVFAVLAVWLFCCIFGCRYVIDAHTGMFDDRRWTWLLALSRFFSRNAIATIVTNSFLLEKVQSWDARAVIIGDVPVKFPNVNSKNLGGGMHVVVVNTFSHDEPLDEVLKAAEKLPNIQFHITGDLKHSRNKWTVSPTDNVHFTGWLSETDYAGLLRSVNVVICLTTQDHTMQRGAYEAMALEKPLITSNWGLLRETFHQGTLHVDNTADEIAKAVQHSLTHHSEMQARMGRLAKERRSIFQNNLQLLRNIIT